MSIDQLWPNAPVPTPDAGGDGVTKRGTDPLAYGNPGPAGVKDFWEAGSYPTGAGGQALSEDSFSSLEETPNTVSGLPLLPSRVEPNDTPPDPPSLQDRMPGTIDKR